MGARFEALDEGVFMASLDPRYTRVSFNSIFVQVCAPYLNMGEGHLAVALDVGIGADVDPVGGDHVLFAFLQVAQVNLAVAVGSDELWHRRRVAPQMVLVHQDLDVVGAGENLVALRTNFVIHQLFQGNDIRVDLLITWNNTAVPCKSDDPS